MMNSQPRKFTLWMLAWPIFIELFLQFLLGAADTLMVSRISDDAVAVVGFSNQLFMALTTLFITVSSGAGILIAQRIGSRKNEDARTIAIIAVKVTALIGLVLSLILYIMPTQIAAVLQLPDKLLPLAKVYISIVGGSMILTAIMATLSTSIRSTGNTKGPMYIAIAMNVVHVILNYGFIFGEFGLPQWGLTGVALSTVISRLLATIVLLFMFLNAFERKINLADFRIFDNKLFKEVLKIGWPLAVGLSAWVFSQLVIFSYIAMLGASELAARTYMNTLESFCFMLGQSIAMALQIQIAHMYGAGEYRKAYKSVFRALWIAELIVLMNAFVIYLFGGKVLGIFTKEPEIIAMGVSLLGMNLVLQPGKMLNMAFGNSLNAVGDTRFIMIISLTVTTTVGGLMPYVVGIHWGWGLLGIYGCMIADEYIRGVLVWLRWKQQKMIRRAEQGTAGQRESITATGGNASVAKA
ncbi:putative transporter YisQ [Paenibacillus radicis (ex Gao et al. 2016)]|uniref:Transporter YisQ n=2 Tax=Paenibacillus radicis (ex Gao et al. 2016) TaxID=1737354 RepID=A0A917LYI7_9BACL|nr:MATE family efflux transporter [Paenibacillus radicis (ex Gao et al. 2016)]GGG66240.1 putative transporter YisQ [Paenibacillus radicis (ex Gao et al. 2016)]